MLRSDKEDVLTNCRCKGSSPGFGLFVQTNLLYSIHRYSHKKTVGRLKSVTNTKKCNYWIDLINI